MAFKLSLYPFLVLKFIAKILAVIQFNKFKDIMQSLVENRCNLQTSFSCGNERLSIKILHYH